jgi:hypothetical protein
METFFVYQLRAPLGISCHFLSQHFYIIRLLKKTHPIEFLLKLSTNIKRKRNLKKWSESDYVSKKN